MPEFRLLICTTHEFLSLRFGTSFSTFLIFILSTKNGSSLRFLCSSLGHSLSASKICSFFSFLISLSFFLGERASTFSDANPFLGSFLIIVCLQRLFAPNYWRHLLFSSGFYWSFICLLLALAKRITAFV